MANTYMPVGISLKDRQCLIVGGGDVALRKINTLLDYDCKISVIAPDPVEKIEYYAKRGDLALERRQYRSPEASHYGIVISASNDAAVNKQVSEDCRRAGVPVNVVDSPELCDFIFPAVMKRDSFTIAVSTDGKAPFLAGKMRLVLEDIFPDRWKKIVKYAVNFRKKVQERWPGDTVRKAECFERFCSADWNEILKHMSEEEVEEELNRMLG